MSIDFFQSMILSMENNQFNFNAFIINRLCGTFQFCWNPVENNPPFSFQEMPMKTTGKPYQTKEEKGCFLTFQKHSGVYSYSEGCAICTSAFEARSGALITQRFCTLMCLWAQVYQGRACEQLDSLTSAKPSWTALIRGVSWLECGAIWVSSQRNTTGNDWEFALLLRRLTFYFFNDL